MSRQLRARLVAARSVLETIPESQRVSMSKIQARAVIDHLGVERFTAEAAAELDRKSVV